MMNKKIGLYIHIPFCLHKCPYCDFCSYVSNEQTKERYVKALVNAINTAPYNIGADTLYIGGGTPNSLNEKQITDIFNAANKKFGPFLESTIEINPGANKFVNPGFTRCSIGVQSLDNKVLKKLERIHDRETALETINWATNNFNRVSADLMLCVPGQTQKSVVSDIKTLCKAGIDHISTYMLQIEEGTEFFETVKEPDEEKYAKFYLKAVKELEKCGFSQYEISNFGKPSLHNLHYWHDEEYLGIGPSAHSFINGKRFYFGKSIDTFCLGNVWDLTIYEGPGGDKEEKLMLALRLKEGVNTKLLPREKMERAIKNGYGEISHNRFSFTPKGFLISNALISDFLCD